MTFHTPEVTKQSWKLKWPSKEKAMDQSVHVNSTWATQVNAFHTSHIKCIIHSVHILFLMFVKFIMYAYHVNALPVLYGLHETKHVTAFFNSRKDEHCVFWKSGSYLDSKNAVTFP